MKFDPLFFLILFIFYLVFTTALYSAVCKENVDIVKLLLEHKEIDVNALNTISK